MLLAKAQKLQQQGKDIINLGIGQPDFKTPEHIVDAAVKALKNGEHGYTQGNGMLLLRETVASDIYNRRKVSVDPENIVIVPGGKVTMWHAILIFGQKGKEIIYPNPGFPIYESVINYSGSTPIPIKLDISNDFKINFDELKNSINENTSLVIINFPSNPTGGVISKKDLDTLVSILEKNPQVKILSDEIYSRILYDDAEFISLLEYPELRNRVIILDGWSKTYAMTGWRIGYGVWPKEYAKVAEQLNINSFSCTNTVTQFAAMEALRGPQESVDFMVSEFDRRRKIMIMKLNEINGFHCTDSKGAFYLFPSIKKTGLKSNEMESILLNEVGVAAVSGTSFGRFGEGYIRFSYANSEKNINLALQKIKEYSERTGWNVKT
ncbi:pyridoxal phosphate-dependent aminotransferase [Alphaproteobacteria bacterium]|nr:pyridoxal phosphate-dependent aminotransferase [Alphaproteobacteria bacterium]